MSIRLDTKYESTYVINMYLNSTNYSTGAEGVELPGNSTAQGASMRNTGYICHYRDNVKYTVWTMTE